MVNENLEKNNQEIKPKNETYFSYYLKQRVFWISILLMIYIMLDIIALFLTTNFTYDLLFNCVGFLMISLGICIILFVTLEKKYLQALIVSIIIGFIPAVEILSYSLINELYGKALYYIIFSLIFAILFTILPFLSVYIFKKNNTRKDEK